MLPPELILLNRAVRDRAEARATRHLDSTRSAIRPVDSYLAFFVRRIAYAADAIDERDAEQLPTIHSDPNAAAAAAALIERKQTKRLGNARAG